ncbi:MAG: HEAT repeat domain-containing protein [Isosphaeraceae bacterium]|nr:HEAT repeat domain-containing protein [Isosphaeraceae bacterium]
MTAKRSGRAVPSLLVLAALVRGASVFADDRAAADAPRAADPRLVVERFASAPDIVHPIALDFDVNGRLLVIESHTHFRPEGYQGPQTDRVRTLEDTDGDGRADRFGIFYEGTRLTMDIAAHPDGSIYLATRNEILRLRDTDRDGKADESKRVVFLETAGNYPHNGLSGLAFDARGDLIFGMGENLGADYSLNGSDGMTLAGGGEGGSIFRATADGAKLRRMATGFWNPFGSCRDIYDRFFAVDNDPDSMPPCRLVQVVEGGDYGYQFRYGRSGRHVFQAWNGELPGTLPMVAGTGEAPCEVISYESDGLPPEYLGNLFVPAWADHRVERFALKARGASFASVAEPLVQGGKDFRPSGLVVAPDGSLYVSDWVLRDYNLHGRGAVWHVRAREPRSPDRPADPKKGLASRHRPLRDASAHALARDAQGREFLRGQLADADPRVRAAALGALIAAADPDVDLGSVVSRDADAGIRALAIRALAARGINTQPYLAKEQPPAVRLAAIEGLTAKSELLALLDDPDPFLRSAAVHRLALTPDALSSIDRGTLATPGQRAGVLLASRASGVREATSLIPRFIADPDEDVRFLAVKWIADEKLEPYRGLVVAMLKDPGLNVRMVSACATALARLDNQDVSEARMADAFFERLASDQNPVGTRIRMLQLMPANHPRLSVDFLAKLLGHADPALRLEAARALSEQRSPRRGAVLKRVALDPSSREDVRAEAIVGLADQAGELRDDLVRLAQGDGAAVRNEALRDLTSVPLSAADRTALSGLSQRDPQAAPLVARVLGERFAAGRPVPEDVDGWLKRLEGPADAAAGRRVFFHPKAAGCFRCHRVDGRGRDVGPDLSTIGRRDRRHIVESILLPSVAIGPSYQNWQLATADGRVFTGLLMKTELDQVTYVDAKGDPFTLNTTEIAERRGLPTSIMPAGLPELLTDQELRDLVAYLGSRR